MPIAPLKYTGCTNFRQRLVLATLSNRSIVITSIRSRDHSPGLKDFEANFLRLLDKLVNGCVIEINETGTSLRYTPGFIVGGKLEHDCGTGRSIGWFLEGILPLAPFGKKPLALALKGVTNDDVDFTIDTLQALHLPAMGYFGVREGLALEVKHRGCAPGGGGQVHFSCPAVRELKAINFTEEGFVKKVRGIAFSCKVSPLVANRIIDGTRNVLNHFLPDVFITSDARGGVGAGASAGYGIHLIATTTSGCAFGAQRCTGSARGTVEGEARMSASDPPPPTPPEDLGKSAAAALLDEIERGGCVDSLVQPLVLTLMALCPQDVSKVRLGKLAPASVSTLRLIRDFLGCTFKLTPVGGGEVRGEGGGRGANVGGEGAAKDRAKEEERLRKRRRREEGEEEEEEEGEGALKAKKTLAAAGGGGGKQEVRIRGDTLLVSCLGVGFKSVAKKVT